MESISEEMIGDNRKREGDKRTGLNKEDEGIQEEVAISKDLVGKVNKVNRQVSTINVLENCEQFFLPFLKSWMKVFRIIPEFRILSLTFHRKSASKCLIRQNIIAFLIYIQLDGWLRMGLLPPPLGNLQTYPML